MTNIEPYKTIVAKSLENMSEEELSAFMQYFSRLDTKGWLEGSLTAFAACTLGMIGSACIGMVCDKFHREHKVEKES